LETCVFLFFGSLTVFRFCRNIERGKEVLLFNGGGKNTKILMQLTDWDCAGLERFVHSEADFPTGTYWLLVTDVNGGLWRLSFMKGE
jgi:hypothetical protein